MTGINDGQPANRIARSKKEEHGEHQHEATHLFEEEEKERGDIGLGRPHEDAEREPACRWRSSPVFR